MTNYGHEKHPCPQGVLGEALDHLVPVNEKERASAKSDTKKLLTALLGDSYKAFIKRLKVSAHDPKVLALLKSGLRDGEKKEDAATLSPSTPKVSSLRPSQSEIDIDKSLKWPLTDETTARKCLAGKAVEIKGPIIVFKNSSIVDGHHRWSQIYACNAKATVKAENLTLKHSDPLNALKAVQMAIAATIKDVPSETVKGTNLLKAGEKVVKAYVIKTLKEELISIYAEHGAGTTREEIANYIWGNVQVMQKKSQPIKGAPDRGVMPQTDQAPGWDKTIKTGKVNHAPPFVKESRDEDDAPITLREQLVGHAFPTVDLPVVRAHDDPRRDPDSDLMEELMESSSERKEIIVAMGRTFFVDAWASYGEENDHHTAGGGDDLMDAAPKADRGSLRHAAKAAKRIESANKQKLDALFAPFEEAGASEEDFGHHLAMQYMGHGVGLSDLSYDLTRDYKMGEAIKVPYGESYYGDFGPEDYDESIEEARFKPNRNSLGIGSKDTYSPEVKKMVKKGYRFILLSAELDAPLYAKTLKMAKELQKDYEGQALFRIVPLDDKGWEQIHKGYPAAERDWRLHGRGSRGESFEEQTTPSQFVQVRPGVFLPADSPEHLPNAINDLIRDQYPPAPPRPPLENTMPPGWPTYNTPWQRKVKDYVGWGPDESIEEVGPQSITGSTNLPASNDPDFGELAKMLKRKANAPEVFPSLSVLGPPEEKTLFVKMSLDPKSSWANGIFHNSRYMIWMFNLQGVMEMSTMGFRTPGVASFRKQRYKSTAEAIKKVNAFLAKAEASTEPPAPGHGYRNPKESIEEGLYNPLDPTPFDDKERLAHKKKIRDQIAAKEKVASDKAEPVVRALFKKLDAEEKTLLAIFLSYKPVARRDYGKRRGLKDYDAVLDRLKSKGVIDSRNAIDRKYRQLFKDYRGGIPESTVDERGNIEERGPSQNTRADLAARFGKQSGNYVEATEEQRVQAVEKLLKFTKHSARVTEDNYNELARRAVSDYLDGDLMAETARSMGKALAYMDKFGVDYDKDSIPQYARKAMQMIPESIEEAAPELDEGWKGYDPDMPVQVVGVRNGKILGMRGKTEEFSNLEDAQKVYPQLDPDNGTRYFTHVMRGEIDGRPAGRFETWEVYRSLSESPEASIEEARRPRYPGDRAHLRDPKKVTAAHAKGVIMGMAQFFWARAWEDYAKAKGYLSDAMSGGYGGAEPPKKVPKGAVDYALFMNKKFKKETGRESATDLYKLFRPGGLEGAIPKRVGGRKAKGANPVDFGNALAHDWYEGYGWKYSELYDLLKDETNAYYNYGQDFGHDWHDMVGFWDQYRPDEMDTSLFNTYGDGGATSGFLEEFAKFYKFSDKDFPFGKGASADPIGPGYDLDKARMSGASGELPFHGVIGVPPLKASRVKNWAVEVIGVRKITKDELALLAEVGRPPMKTWITDDDDDKMVFPNHAKASEAVGQTLHPENPVRNPDARKRQFTWAFKADKPKTVRYYTLGVFEELQRSGEAPKPKPPRMKESESIEEGSDTKDFMVYLSRTLIPDLKDSGRTETAKDFLKVVHLLQSGKRDRKFEKYLERTLIPDLKDSGMTATSEDFEVGLYLMQKSDESSEGSDRESLFEQPRGGAGGGLGMATATGIPTRGSRNTQASQVPGTHGVHLPGFEPIAGQPRHQWGSGYHQANPIQHGGGDGGGGEGGDRTNPFYSPDDDMVLVYDRNGTAHYMKADPGADATGNSPTVINVSGGTANITVNEETTEFPTKEDLAFAEQIMAHIREHGRSNISSISQALNVEPARLAGVMDRMKTEELLLNLGGGMVSIPEKEPEPKQDNLDPASAKVVGSEVASNESLEEMNLGDLIRGFYKKLQKGRKVKPDPKIAEILGADVSKPMSLKGMTQEQIKTLSKYLRGDYREAETTQVSFARSDAPDFLRIARAVGISESVPLTVVGDRFVLEAPTALAFMLDEEMVECSA
jgi:hypothetical protein